MKMMSWSRCHCLPSSLLRAERRCRVAKAHKTKLQKTLHRTHVRHPRPPVPGAKSGLARHLVRYFQFVIRRFRT
jgi:hypothetical protein